jgi:hypothetical protein
MATDMAQWTTVVVPIGNDTTDVIKAGDDFDRDNDYLEDDGTPIDLSSYTGVSEVVDDSGSVVATLSVDLSTAGIVNLSVGALPAAGTYEYDVIIYDGAGFEKTIQGGSFYVSPRKTTVP